MNKLVMISDTHGQNDLLRGIPDGDVLIHCGDSTRYGSRKGLQEFVQIYGELPHEHKILIAGNHDGCFQKHPDEARKIVEDAGIHYLQDEGITLGGLRYWGIPWTPEFGPWSFMGDTDVLRDQWVKVPLQTDVIISHGPPKGILDGHWHVGSEIHSIYTDYMLDIKLNVFGHIHEGYGIHFEPETTFINCALLDEDYVPRNSPAIIYL